MPRQCGIRTPSRQGPAWSQQSRSVDRKAWKGNGWTKARRQPRLTAAPSRASACRKSSSPMSDRLSAMRAVAAGSLPCAVLRAPRRSGAWRSAMRAIARQPRKRLTRSQITLARCWISIAAGPSTRRTRVPGSRSSASRWALPLDFYRFAVGRDFRAHDFGPARHQLGRSKALSRKCLAHDLADDFA